MATDWRRGGGAIDKVTGGYLRKFLYTQFVTETQTRLLINFHVRLQYAAQQPLSPDDWNYGLTWGVRRVPNGATPGADQVPVIAPAQDWLLIGQSDPVIQTQQYDSTGGAFINLLSWSTLSLFHESEGQRRPFSGQAADWYWVASRSDGAGFDPVFTFGDLYFQGLVHF